ncbi:hypothetical protein SAMN05192559_11137 [Halobacillus karajensis]|nr:hypothetical protein [Halobacillus karajensis]SEI08940.1 hypothetical protein SAMN05192559_11137 [Halobacillus karajensis]
MGHDHHPIDSTTGKIKTAFFLNFLFTIIELIGGDNDEQYGYPLRCFA